MSERADIVIVGAGAAGLMTAVTAGRAAPGARIVLLDGARTIGAKILVAGGGRCNVTHDVVTEHAFAGSTSPAIRNVLRRFDVEQTIAFFAAEGVELKREPTGKLFPVTDRARSVLDALLNAVRAAGVDLRFPWRVETIDTGDAFTVRATDGREIIAPRLILATGGKSLPKSGSDGYGHELVQRLGHTITERVFPALVPLRLPDNHWLCDLKGISAEATLSVRQPSGRVLTSFTDSMLCTHFGLSGPAVLDVSRYWTDARLDDDAIELVIHWLPGETEASLTSWLSDLRKRSVGRGLTERLPQRLATAMCVAADVDPATAGHALTKVQRRRLLETLTALVVPVTGDRGYTHAEVTAGGVPLRELQLKTMESRVCTGLHLVGEVCDVDGRIGGYNFQWAWASGFVAGTAAAHSAIT